MQPSRASFRRRQRFEPLLLSRLTVQSAQPRANWFNMASRSTLRGWELMEAEQRDRERRAADALATDAVWASIDPVLGALPDVRWTEPQLAGQGDSERLRAFSGRIGSARDPAGLALPGHTGARAVLRGGAAAARKRCQPRWAFRWLHRAVLAQPRQSPDPYT